MLSLILLIILVVQVMQATILMATTRPQSGTPPVMRHRKRKVATTNLILVELPAHPSGTVPLTHWSRWPETKFTITYRTMRRSHVCMWERCLKIIDGECTTLTYWKKLLKSWYVTIYPSVQKLLYISFAITLCYPLFQLSQFLYLN